MKCKKLLFRLFLVFIILLISIPFVVADNENSTGNTIPFITIDPVGNHTINDTFVIRGTTNIAYGNSVLAITIGSSDFNPAGFGTSFYLVNTSIRPGENGVNTWSAEIIPTNWEIYTEPPPHHPLPQSEYPRPGEYTVYVSPNGPLGSSVLTSRNFFIMPTEITRISNSTPVKTQPSFIVITGTGTVSPGNTPAPTRQSAPLSMIVTIFALVAGPLYRAGKK